MTNQINNLETLGAIRAKLNEVILKTNGTTPITLDINGGTVDGTPIGQAAPASGAFTSLSGSSLTLNGVALTATATDLNKLGSITASPAELNYSVGVTSSLQTQLNALSTGKQAADATLSALAAFNSNGLVTQTAPDTFVSRTITAGAGVAITNGDGVSGNPTVAVSGITTTEIAAATLVTAAETIAANNNDTTIPTSAAVKSYADSAVSGATLGVGQSWQDATASRALSTSYQNTTGKPIAVAVLCSSTNNTTFLQVSANNSTWVDVGRTSSNTGATLYATVPNNHYYRLNGTNSFNTWSELR